MQYQTVRELKQAKMGDVERIEALLAFGYSYGQVKQMMCENYAIAPQDTQELIVKHNLKELEM